MQPHLDAVVLVGAQAVYVHTGNVDVGGAEYTTDADFSILPSELADSPILGDLLASHGFTPREHPDGWLSPSGIYIDLMVPEALAGPGTRGARLGTHGKRAARRAKGLEGATVDRDRSVVAALEPTDRRETEIWVAGPGALLVAKVHKITERVGTVDRVRHKDALDVLRLLRAVDTGLLADRLSLLGATPVSARVTAEAIDQLPSLFGSTSAEGVRMAVRAAGSDEVPATIASSLVALTRDLLDSL